MGEFKLDCQFGGGPDKGFISLAQGYDGNNEGEAGSTACNSAITACSQTALCLAWKRMTVFHPF